MSSLPHDCGAGFKPQHLDAILADDDAPGFFEVHAENYMGAGGPAHAQLTALRARFALSIHGVGLSIGAMQDLDRDHLRRLRGLCDRYEPQSFSEHLAWSSHGVNFYNDLLPLPYTQQTLARVVAHIEQTQETLGRRMLLENPATYLQFSTSTIPETEFLNEIVRRTGCGLLLDINNVYVSATNHEFDARDYLARLPLDAVGEIHLAGHDVSQDDGEPLLIDAHGSPVIDAVWRLYDDIIARAGARPTLIEWDNNVPSWPVLRAQALAARRILARHARLAA